MLHTRVEILYEADMMLLKDIENRHKESLLSVQQIMENELAVFCASPASSYYRMVVECAAQQAVSLRQAAERYKLARKAALFSRLRQQRRIFCFWSHVVGEKHEPCVEELLAAKYPRFDATSPSSTATTPKINIEAERRIAQVRSKILERIALGAMQNAHFLQLSKRKSDKEAEYVRAAQLLEIRKHALLERTFRACVDAMREKTTQSDDLRRKYNRLQYRLHDRTVRFIFHSWLRASLDKRLAEAMAAAMYIRMQKLCKQRAFEAMYDKYCVTRRAAYDGSFAYTFRQRRLVVTVFDAFKAKMHVTQCKSGLLESFNNIRLQSAALMCFRMLKYKNAQIASMSQRTERTLLHRAFTALVAAKEAPNYLTAREHSFRGILQLRTQIRVFRTLRELNMVKQKEHILDYRLNSALLSRAFGALRESAWLVRLHRRLRGQWPKRRGIFEPASGKAIDVMKMCFNQLFECAGVSVDRLLADIGSREGFINGNVARFEVEERPRSTLHDAFEAWKAFVSDMRHRNLRLMMLAEREEEKVKEAALGALYSAYADARSEILSAEQKLHYELAKAYKALVQAADLKRIGRCFEAADATELERVAFLAWMRLVPYAKILERIRFELQLQGVSKRELDNLSHLPIREEIDELKEEYGAKLGTELYDFVDLACELLDGFGEAHKVDINKYYKQLFRFGDLQEFGARWSSFCQFDAKRRLFTAFSAMMLRKSALDASAQLAQQLASQTLLEASFTVWNQSLNVLQLANRLHSLRLRQRYFALALTAVKRARETKTADQFHATMLRMCAFTCLHEKYEYQRRKQQMQRLAAVLYYTHVSFKALSVWRQAAQNSINEQRACLFNAAAMQTRAFNAIIERHNGYLLAESELAQIVRFESEKLLMVAFESVKTEYGRRKELESKLEQFLTTTNKRLLSQAFNVWGENAISKRKQAKMEQLAIELAQFKERSVVLSTLKRAFVLRRFHSNCEYRRKERVFGEWRAMAVESGFEKAQEHMALMHDQTASLRMAFTKWIKNKAESMRNKDENLKAVDHYKMRLVATNFNAWKRFLSLLEQYSARAALQYNERLACRFWREIMLKYVILRTAEQEIIEKNEDELLGRVFTAMIEQFAFSAATGTRQRELATKKRVLRRFILYKNALHTAAQRVQLNEQRDLQRRMLLNLTLLLRKCFLRQRLADEQYAARLTRRAFANYRTAFERLGFYSYNPSDRLRRALIEWKRIARENAVSRHLEVRAERFERCVVLAKIFTKWKAYCHITEYEESW